MSRLALLAGLLVTSLSGSALADCDLEAYSAPTVVVPEYSYAHVVAMPEADAPFPVCEVAAEEVPCDGTLTGCGRAMQRIYVSCVAREVCDDAAQGWTEDDGVTGDALGFMFTGCLDLVTATGGEY